MAAVITLIVIASNIDDFVQKAMVVPLDFERVLDAELGALSDTEIRACAKGYQSTIPRMQGAVREVCRRKIKRSDEEIWTQFVVEREPFAAREIANRWSDFRQRVADLARDEVAEGRLEGSEAQLLAADPEFVAEVFSWRKLPVAFNAVMQRGPQPLPEPTESEAIAAARMLVSVQTSALQFLCKRETQRELLRGVLQRLAKSNDPDWVSSAVSCIWVTVPHEQMAAMLKDWINDLPRRHLFDPRWQRSIAVAGSMVSEAMSKNFGFIYRDPLCPTGVANNYRGFWNEVETPPDVAAAAEGRRLEKARTLMRRGKSVDDDAADRRGPPHPG